MLTCFVGLTSDSRNVRLMLKTLCVQLANIYSPKTEISEVNINQIFLLSLAPFWIHSIVRLFIFTLLPPQSLPELSSELCSLLGLVTEGRPLTLVLDGLDDLSKEHESDLSWLCNILQPHVFIILSASTQSKCALILQVSRLVYSVNMLVWNVA